MCHLLVLEKEHVQGLVSGSHLMRLSIVPRMLTSMSVSSHLMPLSYFLKQLQNLSIEKQA